MTGDTLMKLVTTNH